MADQHNFFFKLYTSGDGAQFNSISLPMLVPAEKHVLCGNNQHYCFGHYIQYSEWTYGSIVIDRNGDFMGMIWSQGECIWCVSDALML